MHTLFAPVTTPTLLYDMFAGIFQVIEVWKNGGTITLRQSIFPTFVLLIIIERLCCTELRG
jgi:hypothetical protein